MINLALNRFCDRSFRLSWWLSISRLLFCLSFFFLPLKVSYMHVFLGFSLIFYALSCRLFETISSGLTHPVAKPVLAIILLCLITGFYTAGDWNDWFYDLQKYLKIAYLPFVLMLASEKALARRAILFFQASIICVLILALIKKIGLSCWGIEIESLGWPQDPGAILLDHINTSLFIAMGAYFFAMDAKKGHRFSMAILGLIFIYFIWINTSRMGLGAIVALGILFCCQHYQRAILPFLLGAILLSPVIYLLSPMLQILIADSYQGVLQIYHGIYLHSIGLRWELMMNSALLIKQAPWFGHGLGSFYQLYYAEFPEAASVAAHLVHPHNEYLMILIELGFVGLAAFTYLIYSIIQVSRAQNNETRYAIQALLLLFLLSALFHCLFYRAALGYAFILLIAALLKRENHDKRLT